MIDNSDLRLINIKKEDELFYKHKIFVMVWQRAGTTEEVARKLGISAKDAVQKANRLRVGGIALKRFRHSILFPKANRKELNEIAKKYLRAPSKTHINPKEFVRVWQEAGSLNEVAAYFKESPRLIQGRASHYRDRYKLPLKSFRAPLVKGLLDKRKGVE